MFSYGAVSSLQDHSKCFTLHPLADLFIQTPSQLLWKAFSCVHEYQGETGAKEGRRRVEAMEVRETGGKEGRRRVEAMGVRETGAKEGRRRVEAMGLRETGGKVSRGKVTVAQFSQETGGKGDWLMGERENDNSLPGEKAAGHNVMEGI